MPFLVVPMLCYLDVGQLARDATIENDRKVLTTTRLARPLSARRRSGGSQRRDAPDRK